MRQVVQACGVLAFGLALWLLLATNVDADGASGSTNCGRGALNVYRHGALLNRERLTDGACRSAALFNLATIVVLGSLALAAIVVPALVRRGAPSPSTVPGTTSIVIPLAGATGARPWRVELDGDIVRIESPAFVQPSAFWRSSLVGFADPRQRPDPRSEPAVLLRDVAFPAVVTSGRGATDVLLVFSPRQAAPAVRRSQVWQWGAGRRAARAGSEVDGLRLRVADVDAASRSLEAAGVPKLASLVDAAKQCAGSVALAELGSTGRSLARSRRLAAIVVLIAFAVQVAFGVAAIAGVIAWRWSLTSWVGFAAATLAVFAVRHWMRVLDRRLRRLASDHVFRRPPATEPAV